MPTWGSPQTRLGWGRLRSSSSRHSAFLPPEANSMPRPRWLMTKGWISYSTIVEGCPPSPSRSRHECPTVVGSSGVVPGASPSGHVPTSRRSRHVVRRGRHRRGCHPSGMARSKRRVPVNPWRAEQPRTLSLHRLHEADQSRSLGALPARLPGVAGENPAAANRTRCDWTLIGQPHLPDGGN